jgi:hypothetical protein
MNLTYRVAYVVLAMLLLAGSVVDPYSFYENSSHFRTPAPVWQSAATLLDLLLLCIFAAYVWRNERRRALLALGFSTLITLLLNIALVERDGVARFQMAFGAYEFLSIYLAAVLARVMMLIMLCLALDRTNSC